MTVTPSEAPIAPVAGKIFSDVHGGGVRGVVCRTRSRQPVDGYTLATRLSRSRGTWPFRPGPSPSASLGRTKAALQVRTPPVAIRSSPSPKQPKRGPGTHIGERQSVSASVSLRERAPASAAIPSSVSRTYVNFKPDCGLIDLVLAPQELGPYDKST
ncbi:hypothetical protein BV25DRAFT_1922836 [Artomyces pyxidatus]|uniref:Uncharacterized protein n=1 Tax=Artomyces pyxidatus TaxID=48021 RepID=A0ACB8SDI3_9AGAM|nr:hypothetical protein BV25DRAFT_1922836 [Artomyces pyxidatus]